jgi:hypothetical protein
MTLPDLPEGFVAHDKTATAPADWDGGLLIANDGKSYWIPPGWTWLNVLAYRPTPPSAKD